MSMAVDEKYPELVENIQDAVQSFKDYEIMTTHKFAFYVSLAYVG